MFQRMIIIWLMFLCLHQAQAGELFQTLKSDSTNEEVANFYAAGAGRFKQIFEYNLTFNDPKKLKELAELQEQKTKLDHVSSQQERTEKLSQIHRRFFALAEQTLKESNTEPTQRIFRLGPLSFKRGQAQKKGPQHDRILTVALDFQYQPFSKEDWLQVVQKYHEYGIAIDADKWWTKIEYYHQKMCDHMRHYATEINKMVASGQETQREDARYFSFLKDSIDLALSYSAFVNEMMVENEIDDGLQEAVSQRFEKENMQTQNMYIKIKTSLK